MRVEIWSGAGWVGVRKRSGGVAHVDDHLVVELELIRVEVGEQLLEGGGRRLAHADG